MAYHSKLAGLNGGFTAKSKVKSSKKQFQGSKLKLVMILFVLICGSVWVLWNLRDDVFSRKKEKIVEMWEEKARVLHGKFNASKIKVHAVASLFSKLDQETFSECLGKIAPEAPLGDSGDNTLNDVCLEEQFAKKYGWIRENIATQDQCSIYDGEIAGKHNPSSVKDEYVQIISSPKDMMHEKDHLSTLQTSCEQKDDERLMRLVKICWWVLLGAMVNCRVFFSCGRFWVNAKPQQVQQQQQQQPQGSKVGGKWRRNLLILWVLSGMIGSMWIFWSMNTNIISRRKELLANMCDERARMLQDQFNVSMHHVHALAILVSTFHHGKQPSAIDQKTFAEYTERTQFERPLTSGVAYALKVLHAQREQFEKHHGWTIKKMKTEEQSLVQDEYIPEKLDPSPVQDEYAPVIFSQDTVSHIVSIDMMSGKEDRENILRARASGKGVLTSPFKLLKSNHLGVVLTFAVYNTDLQPDATEEERIKASEGYLGASFDVPSLVEKLLHQLASKQTIVVNVYDTTNASAPINMYGPNVTDMGLWYLSNLDFGDPVRKHEMHCRFKQQPSLPWSAITTSIGVLVIVFLVGHIFHAAVNRIAKVEDDYRKMRELKVRAEAADVTKSQFLTTVSHEIRTPMNGVLGMLQMLMDTDLDATQQEYARTAQNSGKALITLINEVLDQAKIESGRLELEAVPFDLRAVLDNVLSLFSSKSQEKGIELAAYISDRVPEILTGDPGRFRQIITNLVGNSVKFTEEGHIFVSVHLAEELKDAQEASGRAMKQCTELVINGTDISYNTLSGFRVVDRWKSWERFKMFKSLDSTEVTNRIHLLVMVEDTGVGIPRDAQSRIFMPFMQADSSTSRTYGGTGIGLSISKCLVDLMGGEIGFVSEPRIGSTFTFTAVFMKGQTNSMDMKYRVSDPMVSEFKGMKGLVVDGKSVRAEVTKYHLQRLGINVDVALSMKSAFFCISNACNSSVIERLDMVLVDKEAWGKGTGLAFPRLLKDVTQNGRPNPMLNHLPKMFLLATSISSTELNECKSSGYVNNVIMKPLRPSMMATCLQQAFGVVNKRHRDHKQPSILRSLLSEKQILVVDDNAVNRRVAAGALKKYGAIVTCVDSGKVAIVKLEPPHKFDACFMDVQMPEMDGLEATRKIRSIENNVNEQIKSGKASKENYGNVAQWHIPILAMTADVIQATHEECLRSGMDDYVSKPFEEEKLYSAVAHFFESDGAQ